jgi:hypothetical protein
MKHQAQVFFLKLGRADFAEHLGVLGPRVMRGENQQGAQE